MPRHNINSVYIADGFVDDCDALMDKCSQFGRLSYEKFCDVWKDMQFVQIYHGRKSSAEIAELSEEVLYIAKHYMLNKTNNIEESVAGLFLVYALQNLQPYTGFAALRITPEDVPLINNLIQIARKDRRCDVLFILGSVLIQGPVQYQAAERERGLELSYRKYLEGPSNDVRRKGVFFLHSDEMDILKDYQTMSRLYTETKANISDLSSSLKYTNDNLASELEASFKKLISGEMVEDEKEEDIEEEANIPAIKRRAMINIVSPMKHLTGVKERKAKSSSSPDKKEGKCETSPRCSSPTNSTKIISPRKRKGVLKRNQNKKRPRKSVIKYESDEDSDDDDFSLPSTDEDDDYTSTDSLASEEEIDTARNIEQCSLPLLITSEVDEEECEIEKIDETKKDDKDNEPKKQTSGESSAATSEEKKNDISTFKIPSEKVKKLERRELKQRILKSKFKRMGVLRENFTDS